MLPSNKVALNYIKQNRLKDHLEYDIPLARVDHAEGPCVFTFFD